MVLQFLQSESDLFSCLRRNNTFRLPNILHHGFLRQRIHPSDITFNCLNLAPRHGVVRTPAARGGRDTLRHYWGQIFQIFILAPVPIEYGHLILTLNGA